MALFATARMAQRMYEVGQSGPLFDHATSDPWAGSLIATAGKLSLPIGKPLTVGEIIYILDTLRLAEHHIAGEVAVVAAAKPDNTTKAS